MKRLVLTSLVLTSSLVGQVEHAPTVAQCQADQSASKTTQAFCIVSGQEMPK